MPRLTGFMIGTRYVSLFVNGGVCIPPPPDYRNVGKSEKDLKFFLFPSFLLFSFSLLDPLILKILGANKSGGGMGVGASQE